VERPERESLSQERTAYIAPKAANVGDVGNVGNMLAM